MYDLIIIGSGPAGLSAAVYGKRAGLNLLIIEEKPMSGGQILNTYEVDNYLGLPGISGFDMGMTFRQHAEKLGAEFLEATVHSVEERGDYKCVYAGDQELETCTVIFATGAEHAKLGAAHRPVHRPLGQLHEPRGLRRGDGRVLPHGAYQPRRDDHIRSPDLPLRKPVEPRVPDLSGGLGQGRKAPL